MTVLLEVREVNVQFVQQHYELHEDDVWCPDCYHATKKTFSIEARVHLELIMIKSHGYFNVVMDGSMTLVLYSAKRRKD